MRCWSQVFQLWQEYKRNNIINDFSNGNFVGYIELIWISFYEAIKQDLSKEGLTPPSPSCSYTLVYLEKLAGFLFLSTYRHSSFDVCLLFIWMRVCRINKQQSTAWSPLSLPSFSRGSISLYTYYLGPSFDVVIIDTNLQFPRLTSSLVEKYRRDSNNTQQQPMSFLLPFRLMLPSQSSEWNWRRSSSP